MPSFPWIRFTEWLVVDSLLFVPSTRLQNRIAIFWLEVYPLCIVAYVEFVARGSESVKRRAGALQACFVFPPETVERSEYCVKRELVSPLFNTSMRMLLGDARLCRQGPFGRKGIKPARASFHGRAPR